VSDELQIQVYGDATLPTVIYLPGLHGDSTCFTGCRNALAENARVVTVTYTCSTSETIEACAAEINRKLLSLQIGSGWLIGESFGSQIAWELLRINAPNASAEIPAFRPEGVILAGGMVKHPWMWAMRTLRWVGGITPMPLYHAEFVLFGLYLKLFHLPSREERESINEFVRRRTKFDRDAMRHRLWLLENYDPRPIAKQTRLPVYYLGGFFDPLVPVFQVRRWLRKNCPGFKGGKIIWRADHIVLASAARLSAKTILDWTRQSTAA
jgi:pimeloyl-ACP methyl ester carboxylesterase